jgi:hypothetical protein
MKVLMIGATGKFAGLVLKAILGREPRTIKQFIQELKKSTKPSFQNA